MKCSRVFILNWVCGVIAPLAMFCGTWLWAYRSELCQLAKEVITCVEASR